MTCIWCVWLAEQEKLDLYIIERHKWYYGCGGRPVPTLPDEALGT